MNGLDWALLILLAMAAAQGFVRGFVRELAGLLGWVLGIWAGLHLNDRAASWLGLDPRQEAVSFLVTFLLVLLAVHLLGRVLTTAIDAAQLGMANKAAGTVFGAVRKAFVLSVLLNLLSGWPGGPGTRMRKAGEGSVLAAPLKAFAPLAVPALDGARWMREVIGRAPDQVPEAQGR